VIAISFLHKKCLITYTNGWNLLRLFLLLAKIKIFQISHVRKYLAVTINNPSLRVDIFLNNLFENLLNFNFINYCMQTICNNSIKIYQINTTLHNIVNCNNTTTANNLTNRIQPSYRGQIGLVVKEKIIYNYHKPFTNKILVCVQLITRCTWCLPYQLNLNPFTYISAWNESCYLFLVRKIKCIWKLFLQFTCKN